MKCPHTVRFSNLCTYCGEEVFTNEKLYNPLYTTDVIQTTELRRSQNPVLVIDLDHTILFTSLTGHVKGMAQNAKTFCFSQDNTKYFVTLRPFLGEFLKKVSKYFDLSIYTMGTRRYALEILKRVDRNGRYFRDQVITRDENNKKLVKELSRLGMSEKDVVILDDRADVWGYEDNVVLIKPFYLKEERDFNDPWEIVKEKQVEVPEKARVATIEPDAKGLMRMADSSIGDDELRRMLKYLKRVFFKYQRVRNTKKVLRRERRRLFRNFKFYFEVDDPLAEIVKFYNGKFLSKTSLEASWNSFVLKEGKVLRIIRKKWLYKCIYSRKLISLDGYIEKEEVEEEDSEDILEKEYL